MSEEESQSSLFGPSLWHGLWELPLGLGPLCGCRQGTRAWLLPGLVCERGGLQGRIHGGGSVCCVCVGSV